VFTDFSFFHFSFIHTPLESASLQYHIPSFLFLLSSLLIILASQTFLNPLSLYLLLYTFLISFPFPRVQISNFLNFILLSLSSSHFTSSVHTVFTISHFFTFPSFTPILDLHHLNSTSLLSFFFYLHYSSFSPPNNVQKVLFNSLCNSLRSRSTSPSIHTVFTSSHDLHHLNSTSLLHTPSFNAPCSLRSLLTQSSLRS